MDSTNISPIVSATWSLSFGTGLGVFGQSKGYVENDFKWDLPQGGRVLYSHCVQSFWLLSVVGCGDYTPESDAVGAV